MHNMLLDIHVFPHDVHWQPPHAGGRHAQAATARSVRRESGKLPRTESRRRRRAAIHAANARRSRCPHLCEAGPPRLPASGPARLIQIMAVGASRTSRRVRDGCPWRQLDTRLPAARRYRRTPACIRRTMHDAYLKRLYGGMFTPLDLLRCPPPCKRPPSSPKRRCLPRVLRSPISPPTLAGDMCRSC